MNRHARSNPRRAFTLVELLATIMVLGISVGAALPVLSAVSDGARRASALARQHHESSVAMERIAEILRESGNPNIPSTMLTVLSPTQFRVASGRGVQLSKTTLIERDSKGRSKTLAHDITRVQFRYLRDDGATTTGTSAEVHAVEVVLDTTEVSSAMRVFLRGRMALP